ncbi:uncharacterized protein LOC141912706 [Tubulanus polymorphus]|uniref:uncharacterized protein LOC141912706 n=1 Tax=Tubulanus polymorphus TaxID=672921 RepID=UPI003DA1E4CF
MASVLCHKTFVIIVSIIALLGGFTVLGMAMVLRYLIGFLSLIPGVSGTINLMITILFGFGSGIVGISLLGMVGVCCEYLWALWLYFCVVLVLSAVQILMFCVYYFKKGELAKWFLSWKHCQGCRTLNDYSTKFVAPTADIIVVVGVVEIVAMYCSYKIAVHVWRKRRQLARLKKLEKKILKQGSKSLTDPATCDDMNELLDIKASLTKKKKKSLTSGKAKNQDMSVFSITDPKTDSFSRYRSSEKLIDSGKKRPNTVSPRRKRKAPTPPSRGRKPLQVVLQPDGRFITTTL